MSSEPELTLVEKQFISNSTDLISNANLASIDGVVTIIKESVPKFCKNYTFYNTDGVTDGLVYLRETDVIEAIEEGFKNYVTILTTTTGNMPFNITRPDIAGLSTEVGPSTGETLEQLTTNAWNKARSQLLPVSSTSGTNTNISSSNSNTPPRAIFSSSSSSASSGIPITNENLKTSRFYTGSRKPKKPSRKKV